MSGLVLASTYRLVTGDTSDTDWAVSARLEDAVDRLEEVLDRPLESMSRTGVLPVGRDGSLSPRATPITVATGWSIDGDRLIMRYPNIAVSALTWYPNLGPTVTYTGGWVERTANPDAPNRLPACISDDICWAAWRLRHPLDPAALTAFPAGATSVQLGDASVSFAGARGAPAVNGREITAIRWSPATLRYRYRGVRGGPRC